MKLETYKVMGEELKTDKFVEVMSPITNEVYKNISAINEEQLNGVYEYAKKTFISWKETTISERAKYMNEWADLLLKNKENLAQIMNLEIGKNHKDSVIEIERTAEYIQYTVEEMYRLEMEAQSSEQFYNGNKSKLAITRRDPVGVVLAISPFNYPVNLSVSKIAPAVMAGNVVVFKPATQGSYIGLEIIKLLEQTQIPNGVVNLVIGKGRDIGDALTKNENIDFVNFTGGSTVGENISKDLKMVPQILELGGKDPAIILDDVEIEDIADDIISGAYSYSGQRCTAIKRILVSKNKKAELENVLTQKVIELKNNMNKDDSVIVPLIDEKTAEFIEELQEDKSHNGKVLVRGNRNKNIIEPILVTDVDKNSALAKEEPFGPIVPIIEYSNIDEAIEICNDSEFGLQAVIYGNNINEIFKIADKIEAGTINLNGKTSRGPDNFPFIGYKKSGLGVQGIKKSLLAMTKTKTIVINIK